MNEFFKKLDQQFKIGELDKRQLSEIKRQTKLLLQNKSIGVVRSPLIEELNTLVEGGGVNKYTITRKTEKNSSKK